MSGKEYSKEMKRYFKEIKNSCLEAYDYAEKARKKGLDPKAEVEITLAETLTDRVIGLISVVAPQIRDSGIKDRISELEEEYGVLDWRVAFKVALEISKEEFCEFESEKEAIETGIRVGFAYVTVGVVSSPLEGFSSLDIKKRRDGKGEYFQLNYSGPIRNAGGTAASVSVLIADYVRKKLGYEEYDPSEKEKRRCYAELRDYNDYVTNLQYYPSKEESMFMMNNLPVAIAGTPSERYEVSNVKLKNLSRIETDTLRSGYCLIHSSCLPLKAPKLWARIEEWYQEFDMEQWSFLEEFIELQKKVKARKGSEDDEDSSKSEELSPNYTYIKDLVAGRPVFGFPLEPGGFRLRYGRSRVSGFSGEAIHPATMHLLKDFIASATQLKTERPGKATTFMCCDTIEGPIVLLRDGSVRRVNSEEEAKKLSKKNKVEEILYLGDVLVNFGDFFDRAHKLIPPGYTEEYWSQQLKKSIKESFSELDYEKSAQRINLGASSRKKLSEKAHSENNGRSSDEIELSANSIKEFVENPLKNKPSFEEAVLISEEFSIPLHAQHTLFWKLLSKDEMELLLKRINGAEISKEEEKIILGNSEELKEVLEKLGVEHIVSGKEYIVLKGDSFKQLTTPLGITSLDKNRENKESIFKKVKEGGFEDKEVLEVINDFSPVKVKDKAGVFIGMRMGRPEKAKMRKMKGSPHMLFPVGEQGGRMRSIQSALDEGRIEAEFPNYYCNECEEERVHPKCVFCGNKCELEETEGYNDRTQLYSSKSLDIQPLFDETLERLDFKVYPDMIKGVRGISNEKRTLEHLAKGILRAKHSLHVHKDGTTKYDCSEVPITHFKPKEIGVSCEKLRELGYKKDIHGEPIEDKDQVVEMKPQDVIIPCSPKSPNEPADEVFLRVTQFIDEMLERHYGMKPYYNCSKREDLLGHKIIGLAPHTSAGITGRIIGFSKVQGFMAHPLFHAAMRRDCDGDESCMILLMDAFLNFSQEYLPETRGGTMDSPLVLTYFLNPSEVDDMAFHLDIAWEYPLEFYKAAEQYKMPLMVSVDQVSDVLGSEDQFENYGFTHDTTNFNKGVLCSSYKLLPSMREKLLGQMELASKIRASNPRKVAKLVIERHFLKDIKGNLKKFSSQEFRCVQCNTKYRRPPLSGDCKECDGRLIFTVSEGNITKYLEPSVEIAEKYEVDPYLKEDLELLKMRVESVFGKESEKQEDLDKWF